MPQRVIAGHTICETVTAVAAKQTLSPAIYIAPVMTQRVVP